MSKKETWVDYKNVKASVSVLDVLRYYGVELQEVSPGQFQGVCPFPNHTGDRDNKTAFQLNAEKNCFNCQTHCGAGNVIDLFVMLSGRDNKDKDHFREGAVEIQKIFLTEEYNQNSPAPRIITPHKKEYPPNKPLTIRPLQVKSDIPFLLEEKKFPLEILKEFGIGYCSKGMFAGRVVVPIHNTEGQLVAYAGRGLTEKDIKTRGKWMFPKGFLKRLELFNYHRVKEMDLSRGLVICEGFWSVLRFFLAGIPAVGLMGKELTEEQEALLYTLNCHLWVALDNDKSGQERVLQTLYRLSKKAFVREFSYPSGDDRTQPESFSCDELLKLVA